MKSIIISSGQKEENDKIGGFHFAHLLRYLSFERYYFGYYLIRRLHDAII
jgi:hypothetical protein